MEEIYENMRVTKSEHCRRPQTAPQGSKMGLCGALLCLGLICASLLIGVIVLGVYYTQSSHGSAAELSSVKSNLTECLQTSHDQISTLTEERDGLNARLITVTKELERLQNLSKTSGPCLAGWEVFRNSCYLFSKEKGHWKAARQDCRDRGADLVIINSKDEQNFISKLKQNTWIGLNDLEKEGTWKWVDGSAVTLAFWREQQPDNGNNEPQWGEEDCGHVHPSGLWNDLSCSNSFHWICEKNCFN